MHVKTGQTNHFCVKIDLNSQVWDLEFSSMYNKTTFLIDELCRSHQLKHNMFIKQVNI